MTPDEAKRIKEIFTKVASGQRNANDERAAREMAARLNKEKKNESGGIYRQEINDTFNEWFSGSTLEYLRRRSFAREQFDREYMGGWENVKVPRDESGKCNPYFSVDFNNVEDKEKVKSAEPEPPKIRRGQYPGVYGKWQAVEPVRAKYVYVGAQIYCMELPTEKVQEVARTLKALYPKDCYSIRSAYIGDVNVV